VSIETSFRGPFHHVAAGHADAAAGIGVDGKEDGVELAGALGGLVLPGQLPQEQGDGALRHHPQNGLGRAGHAQVGDEAGALGEDLAVGGGHVGVGPPHGLDPSVQIPAHGPLLAGGLGVEVHQDHVGLGPFFLQDLVGQGEGGGQVAVQLEPAHEVQHADPQALGAVVEAKAPAGEVGGVVGGPEDVGVVLQVVGDLELAPGVVAQGDDICAGVEDLLGVAGEKADAGGILSVDHGEVDLMLFF